MTGPEQRFDAFVAAHARGERPDPAVAVAAAPDDEREALAGMIFAFLAAQPAAPVPVDAVERRAADPASAPPVAWQELLPALRAHTRTTRGALVVRLADELGHPDARGQVEEHLHALEMGALEPRRVKPAVVRALARILDVPESLLELARRIEPAPMAAPSAPMFAREAAAPPPVGAMTDEPLRSPEIDALFGVTDG